MSHPWTTADSRRLRVLARRGCSLGEIAARMNRDRAHIRQRALRDDVQVRRQVHLVRWTDAEDRELRKLYATHTACEIAGRVRKTARSVWRRAHKLGLSKPPGYAAKLTRQRWRDGKQEGSRATQFPKGLVPANKGLRRPGWAPGRMAETQFKPGRPPQTAHNYRPVGSVRVVGGNLVRKVSDDPSIYPAKRWQPVHRMVWEAAHGPVPNGHIIVFRRGMHTTDPDAITLDRLECISRAANMRRNTLHRYPQPVPQLIQLRGRLIAKINRRIEREKQD